MVIITLLFICHAIASSTDVYYPEPIDIYKFGTGEHPKIVLIGNVHGNEPCGGISLEQMLNDPIYVQKLNQFPGQLIVIPQPNPWGTKLNKREGYDPVFGEIDINRTYTCNDTCPIITNIIKSQVQDADLVVEFHEAYDFHKINKSSLGSCIIPTSNIDVNKLSDIIIDNLNYTISDPKKKFMRLIRNSCEISTTLACYCENNNIPYILVEITGQLNKQPLEKRVEQANIIRDTVINIPVTYV